MKLPKWNLARLKEGEYEYIILTTKESISTYMQTQRSPEIIKICEFSRPDFNLDDAKEQINYFHDNNVEIYEKEIKKYETQNTNKA